MRDVIRSFIGSSDNAREIVAARGADYLVTCTLLNDISLYASAAEGNFASEMAAGNAPDWLVPVAGFQAGPMRVYRPR